MSIDTAAAVPPGLAEALAGRHARIVRTWSEARRHYVVAESPTGILFGRHSDDPAMKTVYAHEAAVRRVVGQTGELRSPAALERGSSWLLEAGVVARPFSGPACVDLALAAARSLAELDLPARIPGRVSGLKATLQHLRALRSPVPVSDLLAARRLLRTSPLPLVMSHGDFHPGNLLFDGSSLWVVDWELSGRRPAGYDVMRLWATTTQPDDRDRLFAGALTLVGNDREADLATLRYAVAVLVVVGFFAAEHDFDRDTARGAALLDLLPALRAEARHG